MKSSEQIRSEFLSFFAERGHEIVPSDSLVPRNDPTLLFTNAGMNQFKDVFLGTGERSYRRAVDTQKCLRVSGKHNDLEEVGHDTYHHTFFEMLGNWSFGDYFKRDAIRWAWELLVDTWGLEPDRLYATVHEGDEQLGLAPDEDARGFWSSETSLRPDHILFGSSKDNFWMMGDTGPCGPCSEIHIDLRPDEERQEVDGARLVNANDPRVMEIWNLVFIQYNAGVVDGQTALDPLKARHVDTGMGFERICAVLQRKTSNYDTDLFAPILQRLAELSPRAEIRGYDEISVDDAADREKVRVAMRVVADHIRTLAFAIADGASPGNTGRGYVIRRILRRAVRYGYQALGFREPFLTKLVKPLTAKMGGTFPELDQRREYIERTIRAEEEGFLRTLGTGIDMFEEIAGYIKQTRELLNTSGNNGSDAIARGKSGLDIAEMALGSDSRDAAKRLMVESARVGQFPGEIAFLLHDTYGFPMDLTALMAREEGLEVDEARFSQLMQEQRDRARAAGTFAVDQSEVGAWRLVSEGPESEFVGYDRLAVDGARIRRMRTLGEGPNVRHEVVLDVTPFYAESGGQIGDTGTITVDGEQIRVLDTHRLDDGTITHTVDRLPEDPTGAVTAAVTGPRRRETMKHHSATHLVHAALREVLGPHVQQKGSLVAPDRLRFDFSHYERLSPDELRRIERRVNELIQSDVSCEIETAVPLSEARERGAMALFGEKYGERVRVVTFDPSVSVELCGGTHVAATGEIGVFWILSEGSVASGVRRIEAVAGEAALDHLESELAELARVRGHFKALQRPSDKEVADLLEENRQLRKQIDQLRAQNLESELDEVIAGASDVDGIRMAVARIRPVAMDDLRTLGETLRGRLGEGAVGVLGTVDPEGDKVYLVATASDDIVGNRGVEAGKLVGALAKLVGGGGGGRPSLATAGGRQPERLDEALRAVPAVLRKMLS